jgi:hypothetical protein
MKPGENHRPVSSHWQTLSQHFAWITWNAHSWVGENLEHLRWVYGYGLTSVEKSLWSIVKDLPPSPTYDTFKCYKTFSFYKLQFNKINTLSQHFAWITPLYEGGNKIGKSYAQK